MPGPTPAGGRSRPSRGASPKTPVGSLNRRSPGGVLDAADDAVAADQGEPSSFGNASRAAWAAGWRGAGRPWGRRVRSRRAARRCRRRRRSWGRRRSPPGNRTAGSAARTAEHAGECRPHRRRHGVALLGAVDGQDGHGAVPGDAEVRSSSAEVVGAEGVALRRVAGLVAGGEPLLPLLGGAVGERVLVDPAAAEVPLDEVVADPAGGVQRPVDVVLGDLGDQRPAGSSGTVSAWLAQAPA